MPILNWLTRDEDIKAASRASYRLLEVVPKLSAGNKSDNMLIQGDNLETLKALLPYYAGRIKCIYIDPPYNTRSAFTHYDDNLEHSIWLSLIYPRLELLREFLSEKGSLWISIDDDECHYLKLLCDEIFGRKNFVANVIWEKKYSPQNDAKYLSDSHDHILVYSKNKDSWRPNLLPRTEEMDKRYKNHDNDSRGLWKSSGLDVKTYSAVYDYPITTPSGRVVTPPAGTCWRVSKEKLKEMLKNNRIWFGKNGNNVPSIKRFLTEVQAGTVSKTIWFRVDVGDNQEAKKEVKAFNIEDVFSTPKPERLIQRILKLATNEDDWVLDSFLGSGSTSAVAHKMNRKWIGIELGEHAETHCVPRLKKVIEGEQGGISKAVNWKGGGGFRFYRLGEAVFDEEGQINPKVRFPALAAHIWFTETGVPFEEKVKGPYLGTHDGAAYALLYNGILGDKRVNGGNVLTRPVLKQLQKQAKGFKGQWIIYGEMSRISSESLSAEKITFKQTPYDVRAR